MRIIIAGGGTGGHLFPGVAVAEEVKERDRGNEVLFVGTVKGIEARVLPSLGWPISYVSAAGLKGKGKVEKVKAIFQLAAGFLESLRIIKDFRPDIVLGVGGYASAPLLAAARFKGVVTAIHEQNARPGLTNRLLAKVVKKVFVSFRDSSRAFPSGKVIVSGNPLRRQILAGLGKKAEAGAAETKKTLLIFGGSLGAHRINSAVLEMCGANMGLKEIRIIHQTGERDLAEVREGYRKIGMDADVRQFIDDMATAYGQADLVICRAGATTVAELAAAGKPAILIPYPFAADDHQTANAEILAATGGAIMIREKEISGERLAGEVERLFADPPLLKEMGRKIGNAASLDAAKVIVDECSLMCKGQGRV